MKKLYITLITILTATAGYAQIEIKPAVGLSFANVRNQPEYLSGTAKLGYQAGATFSAGNRFYFEAGVFYSQRSTEYAFGEFDAGAISFGGFQTDVVQKGFYIPVNVGVRLFEVADDPGFNVRVFAGPNAYIVTNTDFGETDLDLDMNDSAEDTYWSARVGAGVDLSIFFIEAAYDFGLSSSFEDLGDDGFENFDDIRYNTFMVNLGVRFTL